MFLYKTKNRALKKGPIFGDQNVQKNGQKMFQKMNDFFSNFDTKNQQKSLKIAWQIRKVWRDTGTIHPRKDQDPLQTGIGFRTLGPSRGVKLDIFGIHKNEFFVSNFV